METIDWKTAKQTFEAWQEGKISIQRCQEILLECKLSDREVTSILLPYPEFNNNFGKLLSPRFFANVDSGDLFFVCWLQNIPTLWSWVEISTDAWNTWSANSRPKKYVNFDKKKFYAKVWLLFLAFLFAQFSPVEVITVAIAIAIGITLIWSVILCILYIALR